MQIRYLMVVLILFQSGLVAADQVYKSVDESGHVTYSSKPPEDSVKIDNVEVAPGPSEEDIKKAQASHEKTKQTANALEKENKEIAAKRAEQKKAAEAEEANKQETIKPEVYRHQNTIGINPIIVPPRPVHPIAPQPGKPATPPPNRPRPVQLPGK